MDKVQGSPHWGLQSHVDIMVEFTAFGKGKDCRGHASVRVPGVLHTNVGHSKFVYRKFKKIHMI